ncbi:MAG: class I SAM-dependent methyltransferase [Nitrososphaeraceae archaeon]
MLGTDELMLMLSKINKAIKNPRKAIRYVLEGGEKGRQKKILSLISDYTQDRVPLNELQSFLDTDLTEYYNELVRNQVYKQVEMRLAENWRNLGVFGLTESRLLYTICRVIKPEIIIETGVASGLSSTIFLLALEKNDKGHLYSIDLPPSEELNITIGQHTTIPKNKIAGWLVPDSLKKRWTLELGDSKKILPEILNKLKKCDLFLHDSDHTYEHMRWEYETVWPFLKIMLLSDDIYRHTAFDDFAAKYKMKTHKISNRMGIIKLI